MSSSLLWMSVEPRASFTQLLLTSPRAGPLLKARLAPTPRLPGGLSLLLEALAVWQGQNLTAVIDAEAEDVRLRPDVWARLVGEARGIAHVEVEWSSPAAPRARFFEGSGDFTPSRRLLGRNILGVVP